MRTYLLSDRVWERIRHKIPNQSNSTRGFRYDERDVIHAVIFALRCGIDWKELPEIMGFGSMSFFQGRRRLWTETGFWFELWKAYLTEKDPMVAKIDWIKGPVHLRPRTVGKVKVKFPRLGEVPLRRQAQ